MFDVPTLHQQLFSHCSPVPQWKHMNTSNTLSWGVNLWCHIKSKLQTDFIIFCLHQQWMSFMGAFNLIDHSFLAVIITPPSFSKDLLSQHLSLQIAWIKSATITVFVKDVWGLMLLCMGNEPRRLSLKSSVDS